MRAVFSILGLLLVLVALGLLAKKQLAPLATAPHGSPPGQAASAPQTPQQFKQALDAVLQQPRAEPNEKP